jgi:rod shape-determining protein MreD
MAWVPYFILSYITLGLQIGLRGYFEIGQAWPNLVLLVVVFIAVNAPREAALLGCFMLGVMQDLATQQTLGLFSLSYGLVAMFTVSTQQVVYREHPLTHFTLALVGSIMTSVVLFIHGWIHPPRPSPMAMFYSALYTAVLAPIVLGVLQRLRRAFSFQPPRRKIRL